MDIDLNLSTLIAAAPLLGWIGSALWRVGTRILGLTTAVDSATAAISELKKLIDQEREERKAGDREVHQRIDDTLLEQMKDH